jgi:hypothetical protein
VKKEKAMIRPDDSTRPGLIGRMVVLGILALLLKGFGPTAWGADGATKETETKTRNPQEATWNVKTDPSEPTAFGKRFQLEIFGGLSSLNPSDLNLRPAYDKAFLADINDFYNYHYPSVGQEGPSSDFGRMKASLPLGLSLRYSLGKRFAVSLGFCYVWGRSTSDVTARYQTSGPTPTVLEFRYRPYELTAEGMIPFVGLHVFLAGGPGARLEFFAAAGPLLARCRYEVVTSRYYSRDNSVYRAEETASELTGRSVGLSLEGGARINIPIQGGLRVFGEAGYGYRTARDLKGKGKFIYSTYLDASTKQTVDELTWEGYWGIKDDGAFAPLPSNEWEKDDPRVKPFLLDLSGAFIRIGLSLSFSRIS